MVARCRSRVMSGDDPRSTEASSAGAKIGLRAKPAPRVQCSQSGAGRVVQLGDAGELLVDGALRQFLEVAVHQRIRQGSGATVLDAIQFADKTLHPLGGSIPEPLRLPMKSAISVLSVNKMLCPRWFGRMPRGSVTCRAATRSSGSR